MTSRFAFVPALLIVVASAQGENAAPASPVRYVSVVANLEVTVANGSTTVFRGFTDENGRFETTPLEPGNYLFQLRIPKMITMPVRYTLALAGARPLGDALVGPGVALGMNAQVRRPGAVRGHVNALRVMIAPAATPTTAGTATSPSANSAVASGTRVTSPRSGVSSATTTMSTQSQPARATVASTSGTTARVASPTSPTSGTVGMRTTASPAPNATTSATTRVSTQSSPARATVASASPVTSGGATPPPKVNGAVTARPVAAPSRSGTSAAPITTSASSTPARTSQPSPTPATTVELRHLEPRPANYQPRIINGRRHIWVQVAGTNMGQWIPDNAAAQPSNAARTGAPTPAPTRAPGATPTPRRP